MSEVSVSAIIANWNGAKHLRICLPSLKSQSFESFEIIVVDNASTDDSQQVAADCGARWLRLESNNGLAPALNRGAAIAKGDLLLFLNNDMRFDSRFIAQLAQPLLNDPTIFATDAMQFNWDGTSRPHLAPRLSQSREGSFSTELVPGLYFYQAEEPENEPVFMASAASMMVRKSYFEQIGGFDDRLPLGYEDVEMCWRAWTHRWTTVYVPDAFCWHHVSASPSYLNFRGVLRGRLLLATKLLPTRYAVRTWLVSTAALGKDIIQWRWRFARERIAVLMQMASLLPQLRREKRELFDKANISAEQQLDFLLALARKTSPTPV